MSKKIARSVDLCATGVGVVSLPFVHDSSPDDEDELRGPSDLPAELPAHDVQRLRRAFQRLLSNLLEKDDALSRHIRRRLLRPRTRDEED